MTISVRTTEPIDATRADYRIYNGVVDRDVRGTDGRVAIPRGSAVELIVRGSQRGDLLLDMESVVVNGQRYAVRTDPNRVVGTSGYDDPIGSIVGAITGGHVGRDVRIPRNQPITFRLGRPLDIGVPDRGVTRDGYHYHDYERDNRDNNNDRNRDNRDR